MPAIIQDRVVMSTIQDFDIPDVDFGTYIRGCCEKYSDRIAMVDHVTGETYTYQELRELSSRVAVGLKRLGMKPGHMSGYHCGVRPDLVFAVFGAAFAGGSVVFAKGNLTQREVNYQFRHTRPDFVFCDEESADRTTAACKDISSVKALVIFGRREGMVPFSTLREASLAEFRPILNISPEDLLVVFFTSGSTGLPKGVNISHRNMVGLSHCQSSAELNIFDKDDVVLASTPFSHISGLCLYGVSFSAGAKVVVLGVSDTDGIIRAIEQHKATNMILFPGVAQSVLQSPFIDRCDMSSMKSILTGGSATPDVVARGIIQKLGLKRFNHGYGLTETCGFVVISNGSTEDFHDIGVPVPMTRLKVVDTSTGEKLKPNKPGEICVKSPYCVKGYLNNPEATADLYDAEGFIRSGDIGYYDERGVFYIVDRKKDMIKCMDQQVSPAELEDLLLKHNAVKEVAVVGVPHSQYGEAARGFVVLVEGRNNEKGIERELRKVIADQCALHKHLHGGLEFVTSIPKTETAKSRRIELRDSYVKRTHRQSPDWE